jgi:hypothetical protein
MEAICCILGGLVIWGILRSIFSGSKEEKTVETRIVRVVVEPPPPLPRPTPEPRQPAPEPQPEAPRPTKCPSCGASLGRKSSCEYCGDGQ